MGKGLQITELVDVIHQGGEIPTLAPVMRKVIALGSKKGVTDTEFIELAKYDTALTARLLRSANDQKLFDDTTLDLTIAAERVGSKSMQNILVATSFIDESENAELYDAFQWFWDRQLFNMAGSQVFGKFAGPDTNIPYSSLGILLDLGVKFLLFHFSDQYLPIFDKWRTSGGNLVEYESERFGFNHTVVGQAIVRNWNLGNLLEASIRHPYVPIPEETGISSDVLEMIHITTGYFFENRYVKKIKELGDTIQNRFQLDNDRMLNVLQQISMGADLAGMKMSRGPGSNIAFVDLIKSLNVELSRANLTYDQMVRELQIAKDKAEMLSEELQIANEKLRETSNYDPLTKIYNRRYFSEFLDWNFSRARRYANTLGCMMVDIDFFKKVNDNYGHLTGDHVLQSIAFILKKSLRTTDIVARFGGEEFIILLPEIPEDAITQTAQRILESVADEKFNHAGKEFMVTVSIGYVAYNINKRPDIKNSEDLIRVADKYMYRAKQNGRNRVWSKDDEENIDD